MTSRTAAAIAAGALAAAAAPRSLIAQAAGGRGYVEATAGAAVVRRPDADPLAAPTLGASWHWDGASTAVRADAALAAGASAWSGQLAASAADFVGSPDGPFELDAALRAAHAPAARGTSQLLLGARRHVFLGEPFAHTGGFWAGALGGATVGVGAVAPVLGVEGGAWRALAGGVRLVAAAAWTTSRADSAALVNAGVPSGAGVSRLRTGEATLSAERVGLRAEVAGSLGARRTGGLGAPAGGARWGGIAAGAVTWWAWPGVGLVSGAGTQPADPARALPAVRYATLSIRVRPGARPRTAPAAVHTPATRGDAAHGAESGVAERSTAADSAAPTPPAAAAGAPVRARVAADGTRVLRVEAPGAATRVQVRGAATAWRPVDLARAPDGLWELALEWPAGAHRVAFRVDDGPWQAPADLPAVDDEYGGRVGLLVVP